MSTNPVLPIQAIQLTENDLKNPGLLNTYLQQIVQAVNQGNGSTGKTVLPAGVDVQGATVSGVGEPQTPTDAVSKVHAETNYSASALAPKLEAGGSNTLKSFRALNSKQQQESYSTFLNKVTNTTPTTNSTVVTATAPSGGSVTITIPAGYHQFPDGSVIPFGTFADTVAVPTSQTITSATRTAGVATAIGTFSGLTVGEGVYIQGVSDTSFDGTFVLTAASPTSISWAQPGLPDVSTPATGGTLSTAGVFYFYLRYPSQTLAVDGGTSGAGYPSDTQQNRLNSNRDGQTIIAVAVVNSSGLVTTESAAGATPPTTTNGNRIVSRL